MNKWSSIFYSLYYKIGIYHNKIQMGFCLIAILLMVIPFPVPMPIYLMLILLSIIIFICLKDVCERAFLWERITLIFYITAMVERLITGIEYYCKFEVIIPVKAIVYLTTIVVSIVFMFNDNAKKEQYINDVSISKVITPNIQLNTTDENGNDTYDVVLCKDADNKNPVIWNGTDRFLHHLILCPTGGGKTATIMLPLTVQDIKARRGVIVIDPKSDYALQAYSCALINGRQDAAYFDPISSFCPYYNVLYGDETDVTETIVTTFLSMESSHSASPYWGNMTENLLRKACMVVKRIEKAYEDIDTGVSSRPATIFTLNDLVQNTDNRGRDMVNELTNLPASPDVARENIDTKDWFLNSYFSEQSKVWQDTSNIRAEISRLCQNKFLRRVLNPPDGVSQIDFPKILAEGKFLSISLAQGKLGSLSKVLSSFITLTMTRAILDRPGDEWTRTPCFLYVDEAQVVCNSEFSFRTILEQGRSYRVAANLATQTLEELKNGPLGGAFLASVKANTRNKTVLAGASWEDAKYFEEAFGTKKQWQTSYSESHQKYNILSGQPLGNDSEGESKKEVEEPYISADEMVYKPFGTITYQLIYKNTIQRPAQGKANFIDPSEREKIDDVSNEYKRRNEQALADEDKQRESEEKELRRKWQISKKGGAFRGDSVLSGIHKPIKNKVSAEPPHSPTDPGDYNPFAPNNSKAQPLKTDKPKTNNYFDIGNVSFDFDEDEM